MAAIMSVIENYPRPVLRVLMNSLSTHDTERALTVIAGEPLNGRDRCWQANTHLSREQRERGVKLLKIAAAMQYTLPGFPCVYYGDEAGLEGYRDPFNRACYPWGREDKELVEWHSKLGKLRESCSALWDGDFIDAYAMGSVSSERAVRRCGMATSSTPTQWASALRISATTRKLRFTARLICMTKR